MRGFVGRFHLMEAQRWFGWRRVQVGFACQFLPRRCQLLGLMIGDTGSVFQQRSPGSATNSDTAAMTGICCHPVVKKHMTQHCNRSLPCFNIISNFPVRTLDKQLQDLTSSFKEATTSNLRPSNSVTLTTMRPISCTSNLVTSPILEMETETETWRQFRQITT